MTDKKNVVVYCSSRADLPPICEEIALLVGSWIASNGFSLVYGGVNAGLMHSVARAVHSYGGTITGVIPEVFKHRADSLNDKLILTANLNERKGVMIELGDIFIVLPGGIGTIDEWISTISHKKVAGDESQNIIIVNIDGAFDAMLQQLADTLNSPYASGNLLDWMVVANDIQQLKVILSNFTNHEK